MKKKAIIIIIILLIITSCLFIIFRFNKKATDLETIKLKEVSLKSSLYFEELEGDSDKEIKYMTYILYSNLNQDNIVEMSNEDMKKELEANFDISLDEEELDNASLTFNSNEKMVHYDSMEKKYILDLNYLTNQDIAKIPIIKYELKKIIKINNKKFKIQYTRYQIDNPYDILNYFSDNGYDTKNIRDYLSGKESKAAIKKLLNVDYLSNMNAKKNTITVTYIVKDDKILIDSIKE